MRTITKDIYKYDELTESAKENAHSEYLYKYLDYAWTDEYKNALKRFEEVFNVSVNDWEVGTYGGYHFQVDTGHTNIVNLGGVRLSKYLNNNNLYYDRLGKKWDGIDTFCDSLGLTGFCADYPLLLPIRNACNYKTIYNSYDDMINDCLEGFFAEWLSDMECQETKEYFEEICELNNFEFDEDGYFYN